MWLNRLTVRLRPVASLYWTFRLRGNTIAIPSAGPLIVAPNHTSFLDPWFVAMVFPRHVRFLITRDWYDKSRFWQRFFEANGTIPVEDSPAATTRAVCAALDHGDCVGIFPEGRISTDGTIQRFRAGIALIAARSGAPVVPLGIRGAFESIPRHRKLPRPGTITVHFGGPMRFAAEPLTGELPLRGLIDFRHRLYHTVVELSGQKGSVPVPYAPLERTHGQRGVDSR